MADVHILDGFHGKLRMVCHIPVPGGNNSAGVPWSTALVRAGYNTTILPDGDGTGGTISAAEKAAVTAGTLLERAVEIIPDSANTSGERLALVDATYNQTVTAEQARLAAELKWFGFTRDVP